MSLVDTGNMNYQDVISYLYSLQKYGIKLGLGNTRRLLSLLGNPHESFKSIHIAGTNGKGSTAAMTASVLQAAGHMVGLFTSPHIVSFTERIKINGKEIDEQDVVELAGRIRMLVSTIHDPELNPTFFEVVTALAFLYFKRRGVDWAVVETGMGGRLDATNVIVPQVTVLTHISYDHQEFLGSSLTEIAREKAGIIKKNIPVVSSTQMPEVMQVIRDRAYETGSEVFVYGTDFRADIKKSDLDGIAFDYYGEEVFTGLSVPLRGMHQAENAAMALKGIELIMAKEPLARSAIQQGLAATSWPGRLELVRAEDGPYDILIDGAHNPEAAESLARAVKEYFVPHYKSIILVLGIMADKAIEGIMRPLLPLASELILTAPDYVRAASPERLKECAERIGCSHVRISYTVREALDIAKGICIHEGKDAREGKALIVITGSFYTIGEAKTVLGYEGVLTRLRE